MGVSNPVVVAQRLDPPPPLGDGPISPRANVDQPAQADGAPIRAHAMVGENVHHHESGMAGGERWWPTARQEKVGA